jgi:hypothetical protein
MRAITAPFRYRSGSLPPFLGTVEQFRDFGVRNSLYSVNHGAHSSRHHPDRLTEKIVVVRQGRPRAEVNLCQAFCDRVLIPPCEGQGSGPLLRTRRRIEFDPRGTRGEGVVCFVRFQLRLRFLEQDTKFMRMFDAGHHGMLRRREAPSGATRPGLEPSSVRLDSLESTASMKESHPDDLIATKPVAHLWICPSGRVPAPRYRSRSL